MEIPRLAHIYNFYPSSLCLLINKINNEEKRHRNCEKFRCPHLMDGEDDKRVLRMKIIEGVMVNLGKNIGEIVKESCVKSIIIEEISYANETVVKGLQWTPKT